MTILFGIMWFIFVCSSVLILTSFPISQYQKRHPIKNKFGKRINDYYDHLFDVYEKTLITTTSSKNNLRD
jgi:hypothetical protein